MTDSPQLADALAIGLQLTPKERLKLVEQLVSSVELEFEPKTSLEKRHWGQDLIALLNQLDTVKFENDDIDDPVEWVKKQRDKQNDRLSKYWNGEA